ncbi:MAG: hypothetical protein DMG65_02935 [Candidatus Angelobacter sp. Gp1-AA117]|nr:MAG: hypothetical protein DMG65_02935 [Candidatus Angelobacter sp. Gp1-AA117]
MDLQNLSNQQLIQRCLASDQVVWTEFLRRFERPISMVVIRTLRRRLRPTPTLVEDLVQNTYLKLLDDNCKALRIFKAQHENSIYGYLQVMASNITQDYLRKLDAKKRDSRVEQDIEELPPDLISDRSATREAEHRTEIRQVEERLKRITTGTEQEIFWLYNRWGLTAKEISQIFQMNIKSVENMLARILRLLREDFGKGAGS